MKRAVLAGVVSTIIFAAPIADALTPIAAPPPPGIYLRLVKYAGTNGVGACPITSTSTVVSEQNAGTRWPTWHPVQSMHLDMEQTLSLGSQSSGAGAGRVTFNPFTISMAPSSLDATLSDMAASGTPFCEADLLVVSNQGASQLFSMRLAAVKTIGWSSSGSNLTTSLSFDYGGLIVVNQAYNASGGAGRPTGKGWNRLQNVALAPSASDLAITTLMQ